MKKQIERKLDKVFSQYVRARDTKDGWGKCVSCGANKLYAELDCGHFINRKWRATRWDEKNCHIQCIACNRFNEGNAVGFALYMLDRFGRETVDFLQALSRTTAKFSDFDGELMVAEYKRKLKELQH